MRSPNLERIAQSMAAARTRRGLNAAYAGGMVAALFGAETRPAVAQSHCLAYCHEEHRRCLNTIPVTQGRIPSRWSRQCDIQRDGCTQKCR
jgi:hypothetical protein